MYKILVIEDDLESADLYRLILRDYTVEYTSTLNEAVHKLRENKYDLIITDLMLPGGNGFDIVKAGYENVIIVTALKIDPSEMYTDVVITRKPIIISNFLNTIKSKLNGTEEISDNH